MEQQCLATDILCLENIQRIYWFVLVVPDFYIKKRKRKTCADM